GFAVPAQNFLYADRGGNIGHLLAARLPRRNGAPPADLFIDPAARDATWGELVGSLELPVRFNPPEGFLASSNDRPTWSSQIVGFFFPPPDRVHRLAALLTADDSITLDDLAALQRDVVSYSSLALSDALLERLNGFAGWQPA